jgi:hypothetical protein
MTFLLIQLGVVVASIIGLVICYFNMFTEDWAGYLIPVCIFFLVVGIIGFLLGAGAYFSHPHTFVTGWNWMQ